MPDLSPPHPKKLYRACRIYGSGPNALLSKFTFYALVKQGRVELLHLGKSAYTRESAEEIIARIDAEDRAAGAAGGPRVKDRERAKRQREQEQPIA
jgi:hypothetical protein